MAKLTGSGMVTTLSLVTNIMRSPGIIYSLTDVGSSSQKSSTCLFTPEERGGGLANVNLIVMNRQIHEGMYVHIQMYDM